MEKFNEIIINYDEQGNPNGSKTRMTVGKILQKSNQVDKLIFTFENPLIKNFIPRLNAIIYLKDNAVSEKETPSQGLGLTYADGRWEFLLTDWFSFDEGYIDINIDLVDTTVLEEPPIQALGTFRIRVVGTVNADGEYYTPVRPDPTFDKVDKNISNYEQKVLTDDGKEYAYVYTYWNGKPAKMLVDDFASQSRISKMPNNSIKLQNDGIFSDDRLSKYKNDTNFISNDEIGYISNEDIINLFK